MFKFIKITKPAALSDQISSQYWLAVMLSVASVVFGLAREVFLVKMLGFTSFHDYLQIYLSLYFAICLFADPARLIYLNLVSTRYIRQLVLCSIVTVALIALCLEFGMLLLQPKLDISLLTFAAFDGILGVLVSIVIFHKQRFGAYMASQLISVIPNLVLIPALVIINALPKPDFTFNFLLAFFAVHIIQLFLLGFVYCDYDDKNKTQMQLHDLTIYIRHFISILGEQFFQITSRLVFLNLGEGFATLLSLFMKCIITARFVFIDSFIGPKLHKWDFSNKQDLLHSLLNNPLLNILIVLPIWVVSSFTQADFLIFSIQLSVLFLGAFYFMSLYRIGYFKINRFIHHGPLVSFVGVFDLVFSLVIYVLFQTLHFQNAIFYVFLWYIIRLPVELYVMVGFYQKTKDIVLAYD